MKNFKITLILVAICIQTMGCLEGQTPEATKADPDSVAPVIPEPPDGAGGGGGGSGGGGSAPACQGDYLVGTWVHNSTAGDILSGNPSETWTFSEDCTGQSLLCDYAFKYPAESDTTFAAPLDYEAWDGGPYNFTIAHVTGANTTITGCNQYSGLNSGNPWHWCNILPVDADTMRMDCNGEANSFYFERQP